MKKDVYEVTSGTFLTKSGETIEVKEDGYFVVKGNEKIPDPIDENGVEYGSRNIRDARYCLKFICEENEQTSEC